MRVLSSIGIRNLRAFTVLSTPRRAATGACPQPATNSGSGARAKLVLARILIHAGRTEEASKHLDDAGEQFFQTVGTRHIRIAERDTILSEMHLEEGEFRTVGVMAARCEAMCRDILHEGHWAILEARLLGARARIGLGELRSIESDLLEIGVAAEKGLGLDHWLMIQVVRTRLEYARAVGDASLQDSCARRLETLRERRAKRLAGGRTP